MAVTSRPLSVSGITAALLAVALAPPAAAQHPMPPRARPLHARIASAELVVLGRIETVETGRIAVRTELAFTGEPPPRFEVKRAPSAPPPLAAGDRALLLLRGARSPYLLVDEPREVIRLVDESGAARWSEAVESLLAKREDPEALVGIYVRWLADGPATLRELAFRGLTDPDAAFQPLSEPILLTLARTALDPAQAAEARRASAFLATRSAAATELLLSAVPGDGDGDGPAAVDLAVAFSALRGGVVHRSPALEPALRRALRHPAPEMRRTALRTVTVVPAGIAPSLTNEIAALVAREPDETLREEAKRILEKGRAF